MTLTADLDGFRTTVRAWCDENVPSNWREAQTDVSDQQFEIGRASCRERV